MKNLTTTKLLLASLMALSFGASCGDDNAKPDAPKAIDAPPSIDAPSFPAAPTLGSQIDRMGRPAINTALNGLLAPAAAVTTMKDNYNHATDAATWPMAVLLPANGSTPARTVAAEFMANLAVFDVVDESLNNATPPAQVGGCGNQALYNGMASGGGTPNAMSYATLATVLADDQLYVDTAKTTCTKYLAVEVDVATGGSVAHTQCGGRAPSHDVIDTSYSLLAAGLSGFSTDGNLTPLVTDGGGLTPVVKHADVDDATFPFLGAPTN